MGAVLVAGFAVHSMQQNAGSHQLTTQVSPMLSAANMVNIAGTMASGQNGAFAIAYTVPVGRNFVLRTAVLTERGSGLNYYAGFATNVGLYTGTTPNNAVVKVPTFVLGSLLNGDTELGLLASQDGLGVVFAGGTNVVIVDDGSLNSIQSSAYDVDYWLMGYLTN